MTILVKRPFYNAIPTFLQQEHLILARPKQIPVPVFFILTRQIQLFLHVVFLSHSNATYYPLLPSVPGLWAGVPGVGPAVQRG